MTRSRLAFTLAAVALLGCGESPYGLPNAVSVTGRVTDGGEPLFVEGRENATGMILIGFCPITGDGQEERIETAVAHIAEDGTFEVVDGVAPGKYVVTIRQWEPYPQNDKLKGRFSEKNSTIIREISGDTELTIDLSDPEA